MAEISTTELPKFNLDCIDIEGLKSYRDRVGAELLKLSLTEETRLKLSGVWEFYNTSISGYYLGKQLNAGIPFFNCRIENGVVWHSYTVKAPEGMRFKIEDE